jgi:hypothetical protein
LSQTVQAPLGLANETLVEGFNMRIRLRSGSERERTRAGWRTGSRWGKRLKGCLTGTLGALLPVLLLALLVHADSRRAIRMRAPSYAGFWTLTRGSGAVYQVEVRGRLQKRTFELVVLGEQPVEGRIGHWVEVHSRIQGESQGMIGKALLCLDSKRRRIVVTRLIIQWPLAVPMDLSDHMGGFAEDFVGVISGYRDVYLPPSGQEAQFAHIPALTIDTEARLHAEVPNVKDLGPESVTTPAGTYRCEHLRFAGKAGEVWLSKAAAPFGLVKVDTNGAIMILTRVFTGAKDRIEATPQPVTLEKLMSVRGTFWDPIAPPKPH